MAQQVESTVPWLGLGCMVPSLSNLKSPRVRREKTTRKYCSSSPSCKKDKIPAVQYCTNNILCIDNTKCKGQVRCKHFKRKYFLSFSKIILNHGKPNIKNYVRAAAEVLPSVGKFIKTLTKHWASQSLERDMKILEATNTT